MPVPISTNDATDFPELQIEEKFTPRDAYLAHDELIDVVGGYEFFPFFPFVFFSSGSPDGMP